MILITGMIQIVILTQHVFLKQVKEIILLYNVHHIQMSDLYTVAKMMLLTTYFFTIKTNCWCCIHVLIKF